MKLKKPIKKQGVMQKRKQWEYRMLTSGLVMALSLPFVSIGFQGQNSIKAQAFSTPKLATMSGGYGIFFNKTYEDKLKEAQQKKEELSQKKKDTEKKLADLEKNKNDILKYIEQLDMQLNELTLHLEELENQISDAKSELEKTRADLEVAKETEAKQYETMKKRIQYLYENGSEDILDVFLSSGSIVEFLNQVEYSQKITEYDDNLLKRYTETKEEIIRQEAYQQAKLEELEALEESALFEQDTLLALSAEKGKEIIRYTEAIGANEELFAEYSNEIANQEKNIDDIKEEERKRVEEQERKRKEEEARIKREEEERRKQEQANQSSSSVEQTDNKELSQMIWPLPGDPNIYSRFGYRNAPTAGASTYHRGVDIGGAMGANIVASLAGRVVVSTYSTSSGNYITIDHGNGVQTSYLHCSKLLVSVGDTIMQGQVIAKVGSTGISTGPHLHFSLILNGTYVDPLKYISYN